MIQLSKWNNLASHDRTRQKLHRLHDTASWSAVRGLACCGVTSQMLGCAVNVHKHITQCLRPHLASAEVSTRVVLHARKKWQAPRGLVLLASN